MALPAGRKEMIKADLLGVEFWIDSWPSWDGNEMMIMKNRVTPNVVMIDNLFK